MSQSPKYSTSHAPFQLLMSKSPKYYTCTLPIVNLQNITHAPFQLLISNLLHITCTLPIDNVSLQNITGLTFTILAPFQLLMSHSPKYYWGHLHNTCILPYDIIRLQHINETYIGIQISQKVTLLREKRNTLGVLILSSIYVRGRKTARNGQILRHVTCRHIPEPIGCRLSRDPK